jgi:hypothetical protein
MDVVALSRPRAGSLRCTADTAPLAGVCFVSALVTSVALQQVHQPYVGLVALAAIGIATAVCGTPAGALAVGLVAALFADHWFVPPYDAIGVSGRDLAVLVGLPVAALAANVVVHATGARTLMDWWRWRQLTTYEMWLLAPPSDPDTPDQDAWASSTDTRR